jgi:hypothetical protein
MANLSDRSTNDLHISTLRDLHGCVGALIEALGKLHGVETQAIRIPGPVTMEVLSADMEKAAGLLSYASERLTRAHSAWHVVVTRHGE